MKSIDDFINQVILGDCFEVLKEIPDNSIDTIITDSPYGLSFMGKDWDNFGTDPQKYQEWTRQWASEVLRVAKHGATLLCFGGARTFHRLACGLEDAGWEIRDTLMWLYGSGFPKSLNISKAIDKKLKALYVKEFKQWLAKQIENCSKTKNQINKECGFTATSYANYDANDYWATNLPSKEKWAIMKKVIGLSDEYDFVITDNIEERGFIEPTGNLHKGSGNNIQFSGRQLADNPISFEAKQWEGYGTALKPSYEPIILAMKPLDGTFAENALKWGVAGLNIDEARIPTDDNLLRKNNVKGIWSKDTYEEPTITGSIQGRFPANLLLDEVSAEMLDEQSGNKCGQLAPTKGNEPSTLKRGNVYGDYSGYGKPSYPKDNLGGASRFFYVAKASRSERDAGLEDMPLKVGGGMRGTEDQTLLTGSGNIRNNKVYNNHPTVKPIKLLDYLVKLTKMPNPNQVYLDPFLGSGTTAIAVLLNDRNFIGIEKEPDYLEIAKKRIEYWQKVKSKKQSSLFDENE